MSSMSQPMQVLASHASVEWYTPAWIVELARQVLGEIDLDPASCEEANRTVKARVFYTKEQNGLTLPWHGRVFLNPPYSTEGGKSAQAVWSAKIADEYFSGNVTEAILVVKAALGYRWFEKLMDTLHVCLLRERVWFVRQDGFTGQDKRATAIVYLGNRRGDFIRVFGPHGHILPYGQTVTSSHLWSADG